MARFQRKHGAVGWPGPQARRLEQLAKRWGIDIELDAIADTGTRYYRLTAVKDDKVAEIKVRVADHGDVYCTADYTIDPVYDQWRAVKSWIMAHGEKPTRRMSRRTFEMIKQRLLEIGASFDYPWFSFASDSWQLHIMFMFDDRACTIKELGSGSVPEELKDRISKIIKQYNLRTR